MTTASDTALKQGLGAGTLWPGVTGVIALRLWMSESLALKALQLSAIPPATRARVLPCLGLSSLFLSPVSTLYLLRLAHYLCPPTPCHVVSAPCPCLLSLLLLLPLLAHYHRLFFMLPVQPVAVIPWGSGASTGGSLPVTHKPR